MSDAPATKAKVSELPKAPIRCRNRPSDIGVKRRFLLVKAGAGHTVDDIRHPDYFALQSQYLGRHDIITVLTDDETQEIELCVEFVSQNAVHTSVRKVFQRQGLGEGSTPLGENHRTRRVAEKGWCVERISDGCLIIAGHNSEGAAIAQWHREQPRKVA